MDILPSGGIFGELQLVHETGYFSSACSLEEHWQQVCKLISIGTFYIALYKIVAYFTDIMNNHCGPLLVVFDRMLGIHWGFTFLSRIITVNQIIYCAISMQSKKKFSWYFIV